MINDYSSLLHLLQLVSPALPVGAYSYSEGLESLIELGVINSSDSLGDWLKQELKYGAIRVEVGVMLRAYKCFCESDLNSLNGWNSWLSANRETSELRQQSWQMGQSLIKLIVQLQPELALSVSAIALPCNYGVAFGIIAAHWKIDPIVASLGYLQSWTSNLISAGVKLIPLGQTSGQQLLLSLQDLISQVTQEIILIEDDNLGGWSWGLSLASMSHQTQYSRLFRS